MNIDIGHSKSVIRPLVDQFTENHFEVLFSSVCTEDGFVIAHRNGRALDLEEDKVAALSSTLVSLAEAAAKVVRSGDLKVTIVEAERANIVVVKARYRTLPIVVTVAVSSALSIGQVLFMANRLSSEIARS